MYENFAQCASSPPSWLNHCPIFSNIWFLFYIYYKISALISNSITLKVKILLFLSLFIASLVFDLKKCGTFFDSFFCQIICKGKNLKRSVFKLITNSGSRPLMHLRALKINLLSYISNSEVIVVSKFTKKRYQKYIYLIQLYLTKY